MMNKSPSAAPVPKVASAGITGAAVTLIISALGYYGIELPPEVAAALATLFAFVAGYLTPPGGMR
jgi:hypothetical protein